MNDVVGSSRLVRTNTLPAMSRVVHINSYPVHSTDSSFQNFPSSFSPTRRLAICDVSMRQSTPTLRAARSTRLREGCIFRTDSVATQQQNSDTVATIDFKISVGPDDHQSPRQSLIPDDLGLIPIVTVYDDHNLEFKRAAGVSRLRTVTDKMGCILNMLKQHASLRKEHENVDFKEAYHRHVLLPTMEAWMAEARQCQLLEEDGVGDVRLSVDVTVMLRRMCAIVLHIFKETPAANLHHYASFFQNTSSRHRLLNRHRIRILHSLEEHFMRVADLGSMSSIPSTATSSSVYDGDGFDMFQENDMEWFKKVVALNDNPEDFIELMNTLFSDRDEDGPAGKTTESEFARQDSTPSQSPDSSSHNVAHITTHTHFSADSTSSVHDSIAAAPPTNTIADHRDPSEKDIHSVITDHKTRDPHPQPPMKSSHSSPDRITDDVPTSSNRASSPEIKVKPTSPDQPLVNIVEKLLMVCPVDMLIVILRHPHSYLPNEVASKVQHLVECSISEAHLQELFTSVSEGEMKRQMTRFWVRHPHAGVSVFSERNQVHVHYLTTSECCICFEKGMPCWYRTCCSKLICEGCLQSYIAHMVNEGVTAIPCPCSQACRGNLYKTEVTLRLTRELHTKFYRFLDNANQNARRKTCPRCSHLTEMSLADEKLLRKSLKHGPVKETGKQEPEFKKKRPKFFSRLFRTSFKSDSNNNVSHAESKTNSPTRATPSEPNKISEPTSSTGTNSNHAHGSETPSTDITSISLTTSPTEKEPAPQDMTTKTRFKNSRQAERVQGGLCVTCSRCQLRWCFSCHAPAHVELTCKEWRHGDKLVKQWADTLVTANEPPARLRFVEEFRLDGDGVNGNASKKARKCPACGIFIERIQGCPHMVCSQCKALWCYDCGQRRIELKYIGGHDSKFFIFGCPQRLLPTRPHLRRFIRGNVFVLMVLSATVILVLIGGAGIIVLPIAALGFASFKIYSAIKKRLR